MLRTRHFVRLLQQKAPPLCFYKDGAFRRCVLSCKFFKHFLDIKQTIYIRKEGTVRMLPIATPANTTADRLVEQVPDVLDKITAFIDTRIEKKGE